MDEIPSAQFRRTYAKLTVPTVVTVNGHPIGTWMPGEITVTYARNSWEDANANSRVVKEVTFNSRPFTPVPKKGK